MTKEEQELSLGKLVQELRETRREVVALEYKLDLHEKTLSTAVTKMHRALGIMPHKFGLELPLAWEIEQLFTDLRTARQRMGYLMRQVDLAGIKADS